MAYLYIQICRCLAPSLADLSDTLFSRGVPIVSDASMSCMSPFRYRLR